jgi:TPM domain
MNPRLAVVLMALCFGSAWPRVAAAQPIVGLPAREGDTWVSDKTGTLDPATRQQLDALIADVWNRAKTRFAVALVRDTGARSIEDYALGLFRQWELGESTDGRGALLVVAIGTRRSRIEVGTVTLATLSDDVRRHVLDDIFRPTARAQGPGLATLRAMEALRDRVAPIAAPAVETSSAQNVTPTPVEMPSLPGTPSVPAVEVPATPTEDSPPWGWIGVMGLGLGAGGWTLRKRRAQARARIEEGAVSFEAQARRLRELARAFPTLSIGAHAAPPSVGYRDTASNAPGDAVEAFVAPLRARLGAAKALSPAQATAAIDELNATLARKIAPLDDAERRLHDARRLFSTTSEKVRAMRERIAQGVATLQTLSTRWPKESHTAARDALDRARAQSPWCAEEHARLVASVDLNDIGSLLARHDALARLESVLDVVLRDAAQPEQQLHDLERAEQRLHTLAGELRGPAPADLAKWHPAASSSLLGVLHEAHARAAEAHAAGNNLFLMIDALTALRNARIAVESARVAPPPPPPSSYDASSSGFMASSNFASSDCASSNYTSSDCASSDCASSDCASSDCASSDCASSDCASSSDCAGSSGDW